MTVRLSVGFASLQLALVDRFVELGAGSFADGVHRLTNIQRRLGLGSPTDPPTNSIWIDLIAALAEASTSTDRDDVIRDAVASLPAAVPEHEANDWPTVGAFSVEVDGPTARTHFYSTDTDELSPLHPSKLDRRRSELREVIAIAWGGDPTIERVRGGSWLYATRSYASLFPAAHLATAVARRNADTFRGMSHWGQFVDRHGEVRPALAAQFLERVRCWDGSNLCELFPIETLVVESPINVFVS